MDVAKSYTQAAFGKATSFVGSDGLIPQLVLTIIIVLVIHFIILAVESVVDGIRKYNRLSATLLPHTYTNKGSDGSQTVIQKVSESSYPFMYPSENEVNGIEFSYSFHLYVDPDNYETKTDGFKNIFYKGSDNGPWPVMGPGVFLKGNENVIRIYMNSITSIKENYVEVPNIPVGKWIHFVITQKGQDMDVFINGNIAVRKHFNSIPRINFGGLYVFSSSTLNAAENTGNFGVTGAMKGMISRVKYYSYALSFSQIDALLSEGASPKIVSTSFDHTPPYFHDSWWVTRYNPASQFYGV